MEQRYFKTLTRWSWLLLLAGMAAAGIAFLVSSQQPPAYIAKTRLIVGPGIDSLNPDLNAIRAGGQLIQTYAELPDTGPFLQAIIEELELAITPDELAAMIKTTSNAETQLLSLRVEASDPTMAAAIADSVAVRLVQMSPSAPGGTAHRIREQMLVQTARLEQDIADSEARIRELQDKVESRQLDQANWGDGAQQLMLDRISEERKRLSDASSSLATLYESLQAPVVNQVSILEPAEAAMPADTQLLLKTAVGGLAGLILSALVLMALIYLADVVDSEDDLPQSSSLPLLGSVANPVRLNGVGSSRLAVLAMPESSAAESYRLLGTRLLSLSVAGGQLQSMLLTGDQDGENIAEIAANLAVLLAHSGRQVVLIDANIHQPTLDRLFGIDGRCNLVQMLTDRSKVVEPTPFIRAPGLVVVPSGPPVPHAFSLLASSRMVDLIEGFKQQADMVIIVGASAPAYADSLIFTPRVDAAVYIAHKGKTRRETVSKAVAELRTSGADIVGLVLCGGRRGREPLSDLAASAGIRVGRLPRKVSVGGGSREETQQEGLVGPATLS